MRGAGAIMEHSDYRGVATSSFTRSEVLPIHNQYGRQSAEEAVHFL